MVVCFVSYSVIKNQFLSVTLGCTKGKEPHTVEWVTVASFSCKKRQQVKTTD